MSKKSVPISIHTFVAERAHFLCKYCLSPENFSSVDFSIEHILPSARGGSDELNNLAFACQRCNNHKFTHVEAVDPETNENAPLYNPRVAQWETHFRWSEEFLFLIGISSTGRATIQKLRLNRKGAVNLRWLLHAKGEHPFSLSTMLTDNE